MCRYFMFAERVTARQRELQVEADRIGGLVEGRPAKLQTAKPKYRGPEGQEWSGRGSKPKWVEEHLAAGGTLEQLKV